MLSPNIHVADEDVLYLLYRARGYLRRNDQPMHHRLLEFSRIKSRDFLIVSSNF